MINLSTDKCLDKICDIMPFLDNIKENDNIFKVFMAGVTKEKDETVAEFNLRASKEGLGKITKVIPVLLKENREDIYNILAIIYEEEMESIRTQHITKTIKSLKEVFADEEIKELFF